MDCPFEQGMPCVREDCGLWFSNNVNCCAINYIAYALQSIGNTLEDINSRNSPLYRQPQTVLTEEV